jgi:hypothetical protein
MIMAEPDDRIWDQFITERNGRLFVSAGFDRCAGWGRAPTIARV